MHVLDNVSTWNVFRSSLDAIFGLYRIRVAVMREFGVGRRMSVLDVGCGTGQYSQITDGQYYGIDMDCRYIEWAKKKYGSQIKKFECIRLQEVKFDHPYDVSLLVDLTHHISNNDLSDLLRRLSKVTTQYVVIFDPVRQSKANWIGRFITSLDRGACIREKTLELSLIREYFDIVQVKGLKIIGIESVAILTKPKH